AERPGAAVDSLVRPIGQAHLPSDAVVFRVLGMDADLFFSPRRQAPAASKDDGKASDDEDADEAEDDDEDEQAAPGETKLDREHRPDAGIAARPARLLGAGEERWIASGGRLVIATAISLPEVELQRTTAAVTRKHLPVLPSVRELHPDSVDGLGGRILE